MQEGVVLLMLRIIRVQENTAHCILPFYLFLCIWELVSQISSTWNSSLNSGYKQRHLQLVESVLISSQFTLTANGRGCCLWSDFFRL